jgi:hypothetical protein
MSEKRARWSVCARFLLRKKEKRAYRVRVERKKNEKNRKNF